MKKKRGLAFLAATKILILFSILLLASFPYHVYFTEYKKILHLSSFPSALKSNSSTTVVLTELEDPRPPLLHSRSTNRSRASASPSFSPSLSLSPSLCVRIANPHPRSAMFASARPPDFSKSLWPFLSILFFSLSLSIYHRIDNVE